MVRLVFLCRRRPDITHERYAALLLEGHVPLALRHHPTMRRYVVNVVEGGDGEAPPLDSIGELWFDTLADYEERLYDSPEGRRIIGADVAGFLGGADAYVVRDDRPARPPGCRQLGERSVGTKLVVCVGGQGAARWPAAVRLPDVRAAVPGPVERMLGASGPVYAAIGALYLDAAPLEADACALVAALGRDGGPAHVYRVAEYVARW
jgi:uncharacterized protein (TIGR02118 family)